MHQSKRRPARLILVALGFLLACGEPTAPVAPAPKAAAPTLQPDASLIGGLLTLTGGLLNGVTTLVGNLLLPCNVTTDQWNSAWIGPNGGKLSVGNHQLVVPRGALPVQTQISAHAVSGNSVRVEFYPTGLKFAVPATVTLSYGACAPIAKPKQVVYLQADTTITEKEPSTDYPDGKWVAASIRHFSSYAVAY
jgi:hypothetical protein